MLRSLLNVNKGILAALLVAPIAFYAGQFAQAAGPGDGVLIDKESEACIHKLVSKRFYNRINATDEQRKQLDDLWQTTADGTRPMREKMRQGAYDLADLISSDKASDDDIAGKVHDLRALHDKIADQRLDSLLKARKILTPEQRTKIGDRIKDFITNGAKPRRLGALIDAS